MRLQRSLGTSHSTQDATLEGKFISVTTVDEDDDNVTKWYVLHAEANALLKVSRSTNNSNGATLYLTLSPCKECSKLILQSGIKRLVYIDQYSDTEGLKFLENAQVEVLQISEENLK